MSCGKHLRQIRKGKMKKLNIKLFSFLSVVLILCLLINFKGFIAYFQSLVEKINNISVEPYYTITFDSNGGTENMDVQNISYNVDTKLKANTFTKTGYVFDGWSSEPVTTPFLKGEDIENSSLPSEYQEVEYIESTGTQYLNTGIKTSQSLTIQCEYSTTTQSKLIFGARESIPSNGLTFGFLGVESAYVAFGGCTSKNSLSLNPLNDVKHKIIISDSVYKIDDVDQLISADNRGTFTKFYDIYLFTWNTNNVPDSRMFVGKIYDFIIFDNDICVQHLIPCYRKSDDVVGMYDKVNDVFYTNILGQFYQDNEVVRDLGDTTLYARWREAVYNIEYDLDGGTFTNNNPSTYTLNTPTFTLNNPTKEGYTFKGWSGTDLDGDENKTVTINKGSIGDREYTANYIPNTYFVKFNTNGGSGSMSNQTMTFDLEESLTKNIFTKAGYKFIGWNTLADGTGESYLDEEEVINLTTVTKRIVNLYAQWEQLPIRYAVQIYGINQDVDEEDNILGLTFGPALGGEYNNAYVTHRYVKNDEGTYNLEVITTAVDSDGIETPTIEELVDANDNIVTRTEEQVQQRQNIILHNMTWEEIASVEDKTLFEDCMLCGDTKKVELNLNDTIKTKNGCNQYGDGAGILNYTVKDLYTKWNPSQAENSYVGSEESEVVLDEKEIASGSNARNAGGYSSSHIRATLIGENEKTNKGYAGDVNLTTDTCVFSCIQENLRDLIVPKKVKYITGTGDKAGDYSINSDIVDSIWLFSDREVRGIGEVSGNELEGLGESGEAYSKFVEPESKSYIETAQSSSIDIRKSYRETGTVHYWWLRSPALYCTYAKRFVGIYGGIANYGTSACLRFWLLYFRFKI